MCKNPQQNRQGNIYKCGKCQDCHTSYVQQWTFRLQQEMRKTNRGCFVTLTYDYANIPMNKGKFTLYKKDVQDFMKRLRKSLPTYEIKYLVCGEYGSKNGRPHYHLIMLGLDMLHYEHIKRSWGKGDVHIGTVTPASIAYTLKYAIKGDIKQRDWRQSKCFIDMSQGIGEGFAFNITYKKTTGIDKNGKSFTRYSKVRTPKSHFRAKLDKLLEMPYYYLPTPNGGRVKMTVPKFYLRAANYDTNALGELYRDKMHEKLMANPYKDYVSTVGVIQVKGSIDEWHRRRKFSVSKEKM